MGGGEELTRKIFRSILTVGVAVLACSLLLVMGCFYSFYEGMQEHQLGDELRIAAAAVETNGSTYLEKIKSDRFRVTWIASDGTVLYDTQAELERAYRAYVDTGCPEDFDSHMLEQSIYPTASSQEVMYFLTSVTLPLDGNTATELRLGAAFDRKTGEALEPQELFTCSPEALITALLNCSKVTEPTLRREMTTAFRPEYLVFFPEHLEVSFPQGVRLYPEHPL